MKQLAPRGRAHLRYEKSAIRITSIRFTAFCLLALQRSGRAGIAKLHDAATSAHNNKPATTNQDGEASGTPYCRLRYPYIKLHVWVPLHGRKFGASIQIPYKSCFLPQPQRCKHNPPKLGPLEGQFACRDSAHLRGMRGSNGWQWANLVVDGK